MPEIMDLPKAMLLFLMFRLDGQTWIHGTFHHFFRSGACTSTPFSWILLPGEAKGSKKTTQQKHIPQHIFLPCLKYFFPDVPKGNASGQPVAFWQTLAGQPRRFESKNSSLTWSFMPALIVGTTMLIGKNALWGLLDIVKILSCGRPDAVLCRCRPVEYLQKATNSKLGHLGSALWLWKGCKSLSPCQSCPEVLILYQSGTEKYPGYFFEVIKWDEPLVRHPRKSPATESIFCFSLVTHHLFLSHPFTLLIHKRSNFHTNCKEPKHIYIYLHQ